MRNAQLLAAIAAILVTACDPGDWKPDAPPAPDCSEERPDLCDDAGVKPGLAFHKASLLASESSQDKHGAQGSNTRHYMTPWTQYGWDWAEWCSDQQTNCWRHQENTSTGYYWYKKMYFNDSNWYGGTSRFWMVKGFTYTMCWRAMNVWASFPGNTLQVCTPNNCQDISNVVHRRQDLWDVNCRSGDIILNTPMLIHPNQYGSIELFPDMTGSMPDPAYGVELYFDAWMTDSN